ncbi:MAG: TM2 domain-containing protein [Bacteroidales bacterium]|nr:TM2 domain-containing protein [Bacteroidales bacterium]
MYCRNCGHEIAEKAVVCVSCGQPPYKEKNFCPNCKAKTTPEQVICLKCGVSLLAPEETYDWLTTLLLCIFVGGLGAHRFYVKKTGTAIIQLLTLGGCGIWTLIDLIMIITGSFKDGNGNPLVKR